MSLVESVNINKIVDQLNIIVSESIKKKCFVFIF